MKGLAYSPSYDNKIFRKYSARTLESKRDNKVEFQKELGWIAEPKLPLLCIPGGMSETQGGEEFKKIIDGILALKCQIVVRGIGSSEYGALFTEYAKNHPHRIKIIQDEDISRRKMYAACDMSLFFAEDQEELTNCMAYGTIPVSHAQEHLENYDPVQESGNSFVSENGDHWTWFAALVRACETYKLPYDWRTIQKHAIETVREEE